MFANHDEFKSFWHLLSFVLLENRGGKKKRGGLVAFCRGSAIMPTTKDK